MFVSDFDFELPDAQIARHPAERRDESRLLVVDRATGARTHARFRDLPSFLEPDDLVVVNDARVLPARLAGVKKDSGGKVELLLVEPRPDAEPGSGTRSWLVMGQASKPIRPGAVLSLAGGAAEARVLSALGDGFYVVVFSLDGRALAEQHGELPLPPYMGRAAEPEDRERYQTIYAREGATRSVAAPTAGLHFTPQVFAALEARGVRRAALTLDVGPGTFLPVRAETVEAHVMHEESFDLPAATADAIRATAPGKVVAVGTTVVRTLESFGGALRPGPGATRLFITPGFEFHTVGKLVTNFHLPKSTLVMLVSAFLGRERTLETYREAVSMGYRFFSYGDAMLIR